MASAKSDTTIEGIDTADYQPTVRFDDLIAWIKGQEEQNPSLRVYVVVSDDTNAPDSIRLTYSHAIVESGANGYKVNDGSFTAYPV